MQHACRALAGNSPANAESGATTWPMIKAPLRQIGSVARDVLLEFTLIHRVFEWNDNAFSICLEQLASNDKVSGTQVSVLYRDLQ